LGLGAPAYRRPGMQVFILIPHPAFGPDMERFPMLETIAVILVAIWTVALLSAFTFGGVIHLLLVLAIVLLLLRVIHGSRVH
jgi:hypothetical protein